MNMKKLKTIVVLTLFIPIFIFCLGFEVGTELGLPKNVLLFVNKETKEYFVPRCLMLDEFDNVDKIYKFASEHNLSVYKAEGRGIQGLNPNPECRKDGSFMESGRSLSGGLLEKIGLLPEFKSRWNSDGTEGNTNSLNFSEKNEQGNRDKTLEPTCLNSLEIETFKTPKHVEWEAILDGCISSCGGGSFTKLNSSKNEKHPRFVGYLKDGKTIPENLLAKGIKLKISGKWISVEDDHSRTVFNNKCVPIVEIEKIEIENK